MNLTQLKATCAAYLGKTVGDLTVLSQDLFLHAANNARRSAELRHNFEMSRISAVLSIAGVTGGALSGATITGDANAGVKEVVAIYRTRADGTRVPLDFTRSDIALERDRTELEMDDDLWPANRYPSDAQLLSRGTSGTIVQRGGKLYVYPADATTTTPMSVTVEGYGWLPAYATVTNGQPEDFLMNYGSAYMQWAVIIELNHLFKRFVARQEGNLGPPEQARDIAWRDLILWDTYLVDSNVTRSR